MRHFTSPSYWECYNNLPAAIQKLADQKFQVLKENPHHPSLHFKKVNRYRAVRIGTFYRALAVEVPDGLLWFWIGRHVDYERILKESYKL